MGCGSSVKTNYEVFAANGQDCSEKLIVVGSVDHGNTDPPEWSGLRRNNELSEDPPMSPGDPPYKKHEKKKAGREKGSGRHRDRDVDLQLPEQVFVAAAQRPDGLTSPPPDSPRAVRESSLESFARVLQGFGELQPARKIKHAGGFTAAEEQELFISLDRLRSAREKTLLVSLPGCTVSPRPRVENSTCSRVADISVESVNGYSPRQSIEVWSITILSHNGEKMTVLSLGPNDTVCSIRRRVSAVTGLGINSVRGLLFEGRALCDSEIIGAYCHDGAELTAVACTTKKKVAFSEEAPMVYLT